MTYLLSRSCYRVNNCMVPRCQNMGEVTTMARYWDPRTLQKCHYALNRLLYPHFQGYFFLLIGPGTRLEYLESHWLLNTVPLDTTTFSPSYSQIIVSNVLRVCNIQTLNTYRWKYYFVHTYRQCGNSSNSVVQCFTNGWPSSSVAYDYCQWTECWSLSICVRLIGVVFTISRYFIIQFTKRSLGAKWDFINGYSNCVRQFHK